MQKLLTNSFIYLDLFIYLLIVLAMHKYKTAMSGGYMASKPKF